MAIQEPSKFVTTDQGHADVLNVPITTLYENDQELDSSKEDKRMTVIDPATISYNLENLKPGKYFMQIPDGQKLAGEPIRDLTIGRSVVVTVGRPDTVTNVIVRTFLYTSYTTGAHARFFYQPRTIINPTVPSPWYEYETVSGSAAKLADHANNADLHITKEYVAEYAAPKAHTHSSSDLPSATTQARGIVQINTSVSSTATDQAAAPVAVKAAYDLAAQAFQSGVNVKSGVVASLNALNVPATIDDDWATIISKFGQINTVTEIASGNFNLYEQGIPGNSSSITYKSLNGSVRGLSFTPRYVIVGLSVQNFDRDGTLSAWLSNLTSLSTSVQSRDGAIRSLSLALTMVSGGFDFTSTHGYMHSISPSANIAVNAGIWYAIK